MKVVYRITKKECTCYSTNYRFIGEAFFTSRKKAVDYLRKKYEGLPLGTCVKYKEGEYLRFTTLPTGHGVWNALYPVRRRYELHVVPVN